MTAIAFLTRLPIATGRAFGAEEVAKAARWFPLIGALLGALYAVTLKFMSPYFPPYVIATVIVAMDALLTGALHLDGLADSADGFGGGRTREDVLRIMRDHAIGTYGAVAIAIAIAIKITAIGALAASPKAIAILVLVPMLGRWSAVLLGASQPYARSDGLGAATRNMGGSELAIATVTSIGLAAALDRWLGIAACAITVAVSAWWGWRCRRRIGGVTGDTLGAGVVISECAVLLFWTALR